jgi:acetyl esterase
MLYAQKAYAGDFSTSNAEISPLLADDLSGQAPAVLISAEFDILRDEINEYSERLAKAGVKTWYKCFAGQIHCLVGLPEDAKELAELHQLIRNAMIQTKVLNQ